VVGGIDTLAVSIMALECISHMYKSRNVGDYVASPLKRLAQSQNKDGSFGNIHATALAIQTLSSLNATEGWNKTSAINWLKSFQQPGGSFAGSVFTTALVLPSLSGKSILQLKSYRCYQGKDIMNELDRPVLPEHQFEKPIFKLASPSAPTVSGNATAPIAAMGLSLDQLFVHVSYTLWVGRNITWAHSMNITVAKNTTFYQIMQLSAERDTNFQFSASVWPNGHYVHTINGYKEKPTREEGFHFWLLYKLRSPPDIQNPPGTQHILAMGVDDFRPDDGDHILFWYKQI